MQTLNMADSEAKTEVQEETFKGSNKSVALNGHSTRLENEIDNSNHKDKLENGEVDCQSPQVNGDVSDKSALGDCELTKSEKTKPENLCINKDSTEEPNNSDSIPENGKVNKDDSSDSAVKSNDSDINDSAHKIINNSKITKSANSTSNDLHNSEISKDKKESGNDSDKVMEVVEDISVVQSVVKNSESSSDNQPSEDDKTESKEEKSDDKMEVDTKCSEEAKEDTNKEKDAPMSEEKDKIVSEDKDKKDEGKDKMGDEGKDKMGDEGKDKMGDEGKDKMGDEGKDKMGDEGKDKMGDKGKDKMEDEGKDIMEDEGKDIMGDESKDKMENEGKGRMGDEDKDKKGDEDKDKKEVEDEDKKGDEDKDNKADEDKDKKQDESSKTEESKTETSPSKEKKGKEKTPKKKEEQKIEIVKRVTRSSSGITKPVKYLDPDPRDIIDDDDDIRITKEVKKDEDDDIEMIEESDPLAISDADVKKAKEANKGTHTIQERLKSFKPREMHKGKDTNVIIIDTNTLLKGGGQSGLSSHSNMMVKATNSVSAQTTGTTNATTSANANIQTAIQAITGGNPAIQGLQSAYLNAIQQVLVAQGNQASNPHYIATLQQYYNTLGALQDDAYVIEAPSFIVPYVMEGKPIESIKDYQERLKKVEEEEEKKREKLKKEKEKEKKQNEKDVEIEKETKDKEVSQNEEKMEVDEVEEIKDDDKDEQKEKKIDDKKEDKKEDKIEDKIEEKKEDKKEEKILQDKKEETKNDSDEKMEVDDEVIEKKKPETTDTEKEKDEKKIEEAEKSKTDDKEKDSKSEDKDKDKELKSDDKEKSKDDDEKEKEKGKTKEKSEDENKENKSEQKEGVKDEEVIDLENEGKDDMSHLGRWESYYKSSLGKFFLDLGLNHAQEFIQADLLKMQKRRVEKLKTNPTKQDVIAIKSLERQLNVSKAKIAHLNIPMKICRFCSYKTESELVMERHLESPHMINYTYKCNFCEFETRGPQVILFHTEAEHNVRGRLERAAAFFQCPLCPFEDNNKSKMTRHSFSCSKKFKADKNCDLSDWEPPAKIPKIHRGRPNFSAFGKTFDALKMPNILQKNLGGLSLNLQNAISSGLLNSAAMASANSLAGRGRGRPVGSYKNITQTIGNRTGSLMYQNRGSGLLQPMQGVSPQQLNLANQVLQSVTQGGSNRVPRILPASSAGSILPGLAASSSITIQSVQNKSGNTKSPQQPSISITPLPRGGSQSSGNKTAAPTTGSASTNNSSQRPAFVICEICDGYIKDLEQLRNHMNLIHKVKIHPKMIYNRPPLNCQKCQHRFFTDQGLERHLLGTHGLVTSSMQEAANKGKDAGRCPICGKVFQWKLLNHVSRDHKMTLKPAHLSYKCTVCTATFNMYRLFENHVYSAHSVVNKNKNAEGGNSSSSSSSTATSTPVKKPVSVSSTDSTPLKINDEITIIPQPATKSPTKTESKTTSSPKKSDSSPSMSKEITITKVGSRASSRRSGSSCGSNSGGCSSSGGSGGVEVISLDDSPQKRQAEDTTTPTKKRTRDTATSKRARTS